MEKMEGGKRRKNAIRAVHNFVFLRTIFFYDSIKKLVILNV